MIRTLTLVTLLALVAGLALGYFVAEAGGRVTGEPRRDPVLESKVRMYQDYYGLSQEKTSEIRDALRDYDKGLTDLFRRLRTIHHDDFRALADRADSRIRAILPAPK